MVEACEPLLTAVCQQSVSFCSTIAGMINFDALRSGKEKHINIDKLGGIVPGLGGWQKVLFMCFWEVIPCGRRKAYTMRAEIVAYMFYLEGPEYSEYVMHMFYLKYSSAPKYGNMLGNSLPSGPAQRTTENDLQYAGCPQERNMFCICFCIKYSQEYFR